ncbi:hypothetical protein POM88_029853 [Heracleum sosnowskyi]|uniref:Uncharacterized protein n=1 Tax=Heracleum sosnowskyi TaxID=360622 RepID=A0AAD8HXB1_9APIA|nr:hypothetical protein POM88_029853 [Heracleum sosnowskyi]
MDTLRVFTTRKKNCYAFNADEGGRILVRAALDSLQQTFTNLQDWHLGSFDLTGSLPDISSMTSLQTIDLHNNSLTTGAIPDSLGTLPSLKDLNLADNQLSGSIPTSLSNSKKIKLDVTGNPDLCTSGKSCDATTTTTTNTPGFPTITGSPSTGKKKNKETPVILGTTIPSGLLASAFDMVEEVRNEIMVNMENQIIDQVSNVISQQAQNHIADLDTS